MFSAAEAPRFLELVQCYQVNIPTQITIIVYMSTVQQWKLSTQKTTAIAWRCHSASHIWISIIQ